MITFTYDLTGIDWEKAAEIFRLAPLGTRDPEQLKRAFENSYCSLFVFDNDALVGMGRALSDGEYQASIYDIILLPLYQNKGIGKQIVEKLCESLPVKNIILYSVPGKERFYRRCGFKKMTTAMAILDKKMNNYLED